MKKINVSRYIVTGWCLLMCASSALAALTDGFTQIFPTYNVQKPYDVAVSDRFSAVNGVYTCWVYENDKPFSQNSTTGPRTEMRWNTWQEQELQNQFECDAKFDAATVHTCIHQIKSNEGGEAIYLQVNQSGTLRNGVGANFASGLANTWFHINSIFNPAGGAKKLYINGSLKANGTGGSSSRDWYFKNGVYDNGLPEGGRAWAQFKNVKHWVKYPAPTVSFEAEDVTVVHSGTGTSLQSDVNSSGDEWVSLDAENTGSWIEFTTPSLPIGTYDLSMMWKGNANRGQLSLKVDGIQVGGTLDQYSAAQSYPTTPFGTVVFSTAGTHKIRLTVVGKNAASSSYVLSADKFTFEGQ